MLKLICWLNYKNKRWWIDLEKKKLLEIIANGESHTVEFKKSKTDVTKDVYESVCAFSNRDGGHIFLGVNDNGEILGIEQNCVEKIKRDFVGKNRSAIRSDCSRYRAR